MTRRLGINTKKALTEAQSNAYHAEWETEIITEAAVLPTCYGSSHWTRTLVLKYLRPYSLGPGKVGACGNPRNRYTNKAVQQAWARVPEKIRKERESVVRGY